MGGTPCRHEASVLLAGRGFRVRYEGSRKILTKRSRISRILRTTSHLGLGFSHIALLSS